jgi:membrane fusion protein (multidrug efflux system)
MFNRHLHFALLAVGLGAMAGCAGGSNGGGSGNEDSSGEANDAAVRVTVARVEESAFRETVEGIGTLQSPQRVEVRAEVAATVEAVEFEEGAAVEKGAPLFVLDDDKLRQELRQSRERLDAAEAQLAVAKRNFTRIDELYRDKQVAAVTEQRWDRAWEQQTTAAEQVEQLRAAIDLLRERLDDTTIEAPLAAKTSEKMVDVGDFVAIGDPLVTLYQQSPLEVTFTVPGDQARMFDLGMQAEASVDAFPDRSFTGKVGYLSPSVDPATRDLTVKATIDNEEGLLVPGMFAEARVTVEQRQGPAVPEEALVATRKGYAVFVVDDGRARRRNVRLGLRKVGWAEVVEGVELGDTIVRQGHQKLSDGVRLKIGDGEQNDAHAKPSDPASPGSEPESSRSNDSDGADRATDRQAPQKGDHVG